jgi:hypothetical protein
LKPSVQSSGTGTTVALTGPPSPSASASTGGYRRASVSMTSGAYSLSQNRRSRPGSQVRITTGPRVTRRTSRRPARRSPHWCTLKVVIAASKQPSGNGRSSAVASTAAGSPAGRCARIDTDGSTGVTWRSAGSYEPAPAPTFSTVRAAPSAWLIRAAIRASGRR